jgi:lauroyl/myristoyl acyltransferase
MGASVWRAVNDPMAALVSLMIWGTIVIVWLVVLWPWKVWESFGGCAVALAFCGLR